ncbi:unnamed protein product [Ambrosiozyma monospora]|uniref:Unnamed protein product n=1 Tax=Ambrosiozyma monospora TaxID=43982 RepID=A0A9W6YYE7_AMBMO|nr:unnamed protein product [Ambrosiozyma monospora]
MSEADMLREIEEVNRNILETEFKKTNTFTNAIVNNLDTTQLLRDAQNDEVVFFKGRTIQEIDNAELEPHTDTATTNNNGSTRVKYEPAKDPTVELAQTIGLPLEDVIEIERPLNNTPEADLEYLERLRTRLSHFGKLYNVDKDVRDFVNVEIQIKQVNELQRLIGTQNDELKRFTRYNSVGYGPDSEMEQLQDEEIGRVQKEIDELERQIAELEKQ